MHSRLRSALLVAERDITSFSHTRKGKRRLFFATRRGFLFLGRVVEWPTLALAQHAHDGGRERGHVGQEQRDQHPSPRLDQVHMRADLGALVWVCDWRVQQRFVPGLRRPFVGRVVLVWLREGRVDGLARGLVRYDEGEDEGGEGEEG